MFEARAEQLRPHFKPAVLQQREQTVFQFMFDEDEPFHLTVTPDDFSFESGQYESPTLTLFITDHATCWELLEGRIDGMQAFTRGLYRADGHIVLSQLLLYLFRSDNPAIAYEVRD